MDLVDRVWAIVPGSIRPLEAAAYGAKAASLGRLARAGFEVPPAFALDATALAAIEGGSADDESAGVLERGVAALAQATGRTYGGGDRPLLLAVRSSPLEDRPGLLPTFLDVGATAAVLPALEAQLGRRVALGVRRRWLATLAVDLGIANPRVASEILSHARREQAARAGLSPLSTDYELEHALPDSALDEVTLSAIVRGLEDVVVHPEVDAPTSLRLAVRAIARATRGQFAGELRGGCVVQAMVFGNKSERSGTGVATSRSPNGDPKTFLEIGRGAQGLDPDLRGEAAGFFAELAAKLDPAMRALERAERAPVDVELVVEDGVPWFVQHRPSALGGVALARAVVGLVRDGVLTREEAVARVPLEAARELFALSLADEAAAAVLARGLGASPGLVTGVLAVRLTKALSLSTLGIGVILARMAPSTEEVPAMRAAAGILAARGGLTCHAAVVARALRKPAVVGCSSVEANERDGVVRVHTKGGTRTLHEGSLVTIDGTSGAVFAGRPPIRVEPPPEEVLELFAWADALRGVELAAHAEDEATELLARTLGVTLLVSAREASELFPVPSDPDGWLAARERGRPVLCRVEDVPRCRLQGARAALAGSSAASGDA